jgi:hypothetical protein
MLQAPPRNAGRRLYGPTETRILAFIRRTLSMALAMPSNKARQRTEQVVSTHPFLDGRTPGPGHQSPLTSCLPWTAEQLAQLSARCEIRHRLGPAGENPRIASSPDGRWAEPPMPIMEGKSRWGLGVVGILAGAFRRIVPPSSRQP